jgi:hypothetical protein
MAFGRRCGPAFGKTTTGVLPVAKASAPGTASFPLERARWDWIAVARDFTLIPSRGEMRFV